MGYIIITNNTTLDIRDLGLNIGDMAKVICVGGGGGGGAANQDSNSSVYTGHGGNAGNASRAYYSNRGFGEARPGGLGYGAGGGGGYGNGSNNHASGGTRGYIRIKTVQFTSNTVPITIGQGGTGASSYKGSGTAGGSTSFGTYVTATGGAGGKFNSSSSITDDVGVCTTTTSGNGGEGLDLHPAGKGLVAIRVGTTGDFNYEDNSWKTYGKTGIGKGVVVVLW